MRFTAMLCLVLAVIFLNTALTATMRSQNLVLKVHFCTTGGRKNQKKTQIRCTKFGPKEKWPKNFTKNGPKTLYEKWPKRKMSQNQLRKMAQSKNDPLKNEKLPNEKWPKKFLKYKISLKINRYLK